MNVQEIMTTDAVSTTPDTTALGITKQMVQHDVSAVLVCEGDVVLGIVSYDDVMQLVADESSLSVTANDIMADDIVSISSSETLEAAAEMMVSHGITTLPVIDEGKLQGVVSASDLIQYEDSLVEKLSQMFLASKAQGALGGKKQMAG